MSAAALATLAWRFFVIAFLAIGGVNAAVPEIHRQVVEVERWMTNGEFAALFAIANAAPGPNMLLVTLVGWHVAGVVGALLATVALVGPTSILVYVVFHLWDRFRDALWRRPVQNGLSAVTVGLIAASAFLLARAADTGWVSMAVAGGTALVSYLTRLNPLWFFGAAAVVGAAGLV
ncbi:chromate transporter [Enterovirga aerilata]|uniref:Chromate transporter n=1 Tax=Enterovirga aerilata TaxID=2730920 RepID=A0A849IAM2_9HYPH|nr:chromate transporter [Enterovirga sp. DB1703]